MDSSDASAMALRLMALTDSLEQRSAQAVQEVANSSAVLAQAAQGLNQQGQWLVQDSVSAISAQARDALNTGMKQAMDQYQVELQQAGRQASQAAASLSEQSAALRRTQRGLAWKSSLALFIGAAFAAGGSAYFLWKNWEVSRQAQFSTAVIEAIRAGTLAECEGVLCVKAGKNSARYPKNGDYLLIRP